MPDKKTLAHTDARSSDSSCWAPHSWSPGWTPSAVLSAGLSDDAALTVKPFHRKGGRQKSRKGMWQYFDLRQVREMLLKFKLFQKKKKKTCTHFIYQEEIFSLGMSQSLHKKIFCSLKESKLSYHRNPYISIWVFFFFSKQGLRFPHLSTPES